MRQKNRITLTDNYVEQMPLNDARAFAIISYLKNI